MADLRGALPLISPDDRETWVKVGHALAAHADQGRELWFWWSETYDKTGKFDRADAERVWSSFNPDSIDYRAVFGIAKERGWKNAAVDTAGDEPGPRLTEVPLDDIMSARIDPPKFIVGGLVPRGECTLLGGHGGAGKSLLSLAMGACVAAGQPWGPFAVESGRVLVVSLEDDASKLRYRLKRIIETYALDAGAVTANMHVVDGSEAGPLVFEHASDGVRRIAQSAVFTEVADLARGADLVIVDNASDAFDADENSKRQVRTFIKHLAKMVRGHDGAVVLLAHIDKAGAKYGTQGNSFSGSVAWNNSVRSRLALIDDVLVHEKSNFGAKQEPIKVEWLSGVPVLLARGVQQAQQAQRQADDDAAVLAAIRAVVAQGGDVRAADSGSVMAWHSLHARGELSEELRADDATAKRRVKESTHRLADAGKIHRETFTVNGNKRQRWVPVTE